MANTKRGYVTHCRNPKCPQKAKEDWDALVIRIDRYSDGSEEAELECQWCGHRWNAVSGWQTYRKAQGFKVVDNGALLNRPTSIF